MTTINSTSNYYHNYRPFTKTTTPDTKHLQKRWSDQELSHDDKRRLRQLEQYIMWGLKSFHPTTSTVIQGRGIESKKKKYFDDYVAMVLEIKGEKEYREVIKNKEEILSWKVKCTEK